MVNMGEVRLSSDQMRSFTTTRGTGAWPTSQCFVSAERVLFNRRDRHA